MRLYNISEVEIDSCFVGSVVVYVFNESNGRTLEVRVRGCSEPLIIDAFRIRFRVAGLRKSKNMFKIEADPKADAVYIQITDSPAAYAKEITDDIVADYSENGELIGLDLQRFSLMTKELQWAANVQA